MSATRRGFLGLLGGLAAAGFACGSDAQADAIRLAVYFHRKMMRLDAAGQFVEMASAAAAGALAVEPDYSASAFHLTPSLRTISKASQLALYYAPATAQVEPVLGLSAVPLLAASVEEAETLLRIARPYYDAALARHDQVLLATQPWRPGMLWSRMAIRSPADIAGRDFGLGGPAEMEAGWRAPLERLAARLTRANPEMVLSAGVGGSIGRFTPIYRNVAEVFVASPLNFLTANRDFLASLPPAHQEVLLSAGRACEAAQWRGIRELMELDSDEIAADGVTVVADPPKDLMEALRSAAEPSIQSWVQSAGPDAAEIIARYRRATGRD